MEALKLPLTEEITGIPPLTDEAHLGQNFQEWPPSIQLGILSRRLVFRKPEQPELEAIAIGDVDCIIRLVIH